MSSRGQRGAWHPQLAGRANCSTIANVPNKVPSNMSKSISPGTACSQRRCSKSCLPCHV